MTAGVEAWRQKTQTNYKTEQKQGPAIPRFLITSSEVATLDFIKSLDELWGHPRTTPALSFVCSLLHAWGVTRGWHWCLGDGYLCAALRYQTEPGLALSLSKTPREVWMKVMVRLCF